MSDIKLNGIVIGWLKHASFKLIYNNKIIYIDPFQLKQEEDKADLILITHSHFDHCSIEDIKKILKENTTIISSTDCISQLNRFERTELKIMHPDTKIEVNNIQIEAIPSYNLKKQFHPKDNNWLGYIITIDNKRIYHAGDTDLTPEMSSLKNIDIALLPIGGTYTMNVKEAAQAANLIKPKIVIPMHYNSIQGTNANPEDFKSLVKKEIEVKILSQ